MSVAAELESLTALPREQLLRVALETMQVGHLLDRALMPQVAIETKSMDAVEETAIAEWMGASPVYTGRMRRLMGVEGDGVGEIMKVLQLDVGFPHQYMDVAWKLVDPTYGEFWLRHCGALMDVEPHGEKRVVGMCHHIEDPTFDATAYATNPRARIRPIHRPPRVPADRTPHCHWTIEIDPANPPVEAATHTRAVAALPLARLALPPIAADDADGRADYRGAFDPGFRLGRLAPATLAAVTREFRVQSHLLVSSAEMTLTERLGRDVARRLLAAQWVGACWIASERLARALGGTGGGAEAIALVLRHVATLAPGFARRIETATDRVRVVLLPERAELLDPEQPGWLGLLVRGEPGGLEALARAVEPRARLDAHAIRDGAIMLEIAIDPSAEPAAAPQPVALTRISTAASWRFDLARAR